mmetsp:Transcript_13287/g.43149  ORF Transcript_13287/g.43149 Transcript_13287/m.43149 type:complete len:487 (+) Transcript_13287:32-1492(+)
MGKSKGGSKAQQHKPPSAKRKADKHFTTIAVAAAVSSALAATILPGWLSNPLQPPPERREGAVAGQGDGSAGARGKSAHEAVIAALDRDGIEVPEAARRGAVRGGDPGCVDEDSNCETWAKSGECFKNEQYMQKRCRASCHVCDGGKPKPRKAEACEDVNRMCATWAAIGECQSNPGYMLTQCPVTCKMCQSATCRDEWADCTERCRGGPESNYSESVNCYSMPELVEHCAWTCGACKEHRFDRPQCARGVNAEPAAVPGSVDRIFGRIAAEQPGTTMLSREPWVLLIEDFMTSDEADEILKAGALAGSGFERSQAGDGVQSARTSSTAWCKGSCLRNPTVQAIEKRVSSLLGGIPMDNAEPMQVLRYETGQYYRVHHDQNSPRSSAWGPRMFTVFMYIGDHNSYTGGETHFPRLNITIPAKKGAACVWTSVLDSDPYQRDDRTDHESLPVTSGVKFGVNYWIHMYKFRSFSGGVCDNQAYVQNWR